MGLKGPSSRVRVLLVLDRRAEAGMWIVDGQWGDGCNRDRSVCPIFFGTMLLAMIVHQDEWGWVENKGRRERDTHTGSLNKKRPDQPGWSSRTYLPLFIIT